MPPKTTTAATAPGPPRGRWAMMYIYCMSLILSLGGLNAPGLCVDSAITYYNASDLAFDTVYYMGYADRALVSILFYYLVRRFSVRTAMIVGSSLMVVGYAIQMLYRMSFVPLIIGGMLVDCVYALVWITIAGFTTTWFDSNWKSKTFGIIYLGATVASVVVFVLLRELITTADEFGDRYLWFTLAFLVCAVSNFLVVLFVFQDTPDTPISFSVRPTDTDAIALLPPAAAAASASDDDNDDPAAMLDDGMLDNEDADGDDTSGDDIHPRRSGPLPPTQQQAKRRCIDHDCVSWMSVCHFGANHPHVAAYIAVYIITIAGVWTLTSLMYQIPYNHGYSHSQITVLGAVFAALSLPTPVITGVLMDLTKAYRAITLTTVAVTTGSLFMWIVTIDHGVAFFIAVGLVAFATGSYTVCFYTAITELSFPLPEAQISMMVFFLSQFSGALGTLLTSTPSWSSTMIWIFASLSAAGTIILIVDITVPAEDGRAAADQRTWQRVPQSSHSISTDAYRARHAASTNKRTNTNNSSLVVAAA